MPEGLVYVDVDGGTHLLGGEACPPDGLDGRFMPPAQLTIDEDPGSDGGSLKFVRFGTKTVTAPWFVTGDDAVDVRSALRAVVRACNPKRGAGLLVNTAPDGSVRELDALYESGMGVEENLQTRGETVQVLVVVFRALDPFWRARTDSTHSFVAASTSTFFPFFPLTLTGSEVFSSETVDNVGDVEAWPTWTVTGPAVGVTLINVTTGLRLGVSTTLAAGESLSIVTAPGSQAVTDSGGASLFADLTADRDFWPLEPGANVVRIEGSGFTPGTTAVSASWRPRYLSP